MAVTNVIERTVDIDVGVTQEDLHRLFAVADARAHTFRITVTSKGQAQSLSGHTVVGYFMTRYYGTVVITGSVSGNIATLVLPATCYAHNDGFQLIIRLVSGSTKTAIYWGNGYVSRSASDPTIDPGSVVPNLDDILAELDQMEQATEAANQAATNANAAAEQSVRFDTAQTKTDAQKLQARNNAGAAGTGSIAPAYAQTTYAVGDMVTQGGKLYKCTTAIETAEEWTVSHWTEVAVSDEITNLKEDLSEITEELPDTVERKVYTPIAYNLQSKTKTQNGITFTQNTNETINVSGTATNTAMTSFTDANGNELSFALTAGKTYRLSGCPAGGGLESYRLDLRAGSSGGTVTATDKGSGVIVTIATTGSYIPVIRIGNGTTVNLTFAPEIAEETVYVVNPLSAIDLVAREDLNETVKFTEQSLTEFQKAQARSNIGADSIPWFYVDEDGYMCQNVTEVINNGN